MVKSWRVVLGACSLAALLGAACSSKETPVVEAPPEPPKEVARREIGAAGGVLSGGGATLEIPEGALPANVNVVIKVVDPRTIVHQPNTIVVGTVYSFEPEDITFLKPVTVKLDVDVLKKPGAPRGALVMLRAPSGSSDWKMRGGALFKESVVIGKATHFSVWMPVVMTGLACLEEALPPGCAPDPARPGFLNCSLPGAGNSIRCVGTGPNETGPYSCACSDGTAVAELTSIPSASELATWAAQCGGLCPPPQTRCDVGLVCDPPNGDPPPPPDPSTYDAASPPPPPVNRWTCKTTKGPELTCTLPWAAELADCTCPGKPPFKAQIGQPTADAFHNIWAPYCGGCNTQVVDGVPPLPPAREYDCPRPVVTNTGPTCDMAPVACRDGKTYEVDCDLTPGGTCSCRVNGVSQRTVPLGAGCNFATCQFPLSHP